MCRAPGRVKGLQEQWPCSFCHPLPSFRIFALGHINSESRNLQMLLLAASASCHGDGTEYRAPISSFSALSPPGLLQESRDGWAAKPLPWILDLTFCESSLMQLLHLVYLRAPVGGFSDGTWAVSSRCKTLRCIE